MRKVYLRTGFLLSLVGVICKLEGIIVWPWIIILCPFLVDDGLELITYLINRKK